MYHLMFERNLLSFSFFTSCINIIILYSVVCIKTSVSNRVYSLLTFSFVFPYIHFRPREESHYLHRVKLAHIRNIL